MSRKTSRRSTSTSMVKSRSKMDRYTEDLRYSLRRSLGESVDKASLCADDILARSHRQIVADFTDPRQWYYSATHDYIIGMLRAESQRQSRYQESRYWHRSAMSMPRSLLSTGKLSSLSDGRSSTRGSPHAARSDDMADRRRENLIRIPTETSIDLRAIRRDDPAANRDATDSKSTRPQHDEGHKRHGRGTASDPFDATPSASAIRNHHKSAPATTINELADHTMHHKKTGRESLPGYAETYVAGNSPDIGSVRSSMNPLNPDASALPRDDPSAVSQQQSAGSLMSLDDPLTFSRKDENLTRDGNKVMDLQKDGSKFSEQKTIDKVSKISTPAMETYRASKQSQSDLALKDTSRSHPAGHAHFAPLPGINMIKEPFIPLEKRNSRTFKESKEAPNCFPSVIQQSELSPRQAKPSPRQFQTHQAARDNPTKCMSWKRKAGPKSTFDPMFGQRVDDAKYVEDWVKKLELTDLAKRTVLPNSSIDPDRTSHYDHGIGINNPTDRRHQILHHHHHHHKEPRHVKSMSLPNDFQSLPSFQPLHPMPSLYIYSMKQKSDLKVKFNHFQIPRPLRQQDNILQAEADHTFERDLKEARSRVDYVENRLGELYETEKELVKVVARKTSRTTTKKPSGTAKDRPIAIEAKQILTAGHVGHASSEDKDGKSVDVDHALNYTGLQQQHQIKKVDSDVESIAGSLCQVNGLSEPSMSLSPQDETNSKVSVVSLSLPEQTEELVIPDNQQETTGGETKAISNPLDNDLQQSPSTSPRKQAPTSPVRSKEVRVLEGKMIRVFDDHGEITPMSCSSRPLIRTDANGNHYADHRSGDGNRDNSAPDPSGPSGLGISPVAEEVVREILDQLESLDDGTERSMSVAISESLPSPHGVLPGVKVPTSKGGLTTSPSVPPINVTNAPSEDSNAYEITREDTNLTSLSSTPIPRCIFCEDSH